MTVHTCCVNVHSKSSLNQRPTMHCQLMCVAKHISLVSNTPTEKTTLVITDSVLCYIKPTTATTVGSIPGAWVVTKANLKRLMKQSPKSGSKGALFGTLCKGQNYCWGPFSFPVFTTMQKIKILRKCFISNLMFCTVHFIFTLLNC